MLEPGRLWAGGRHEEGTCSIGKGEGRLWKQNTKREASELVRGHDDHGAAGSKKL